VSNCGFELQKKSTEKPPGFGRDHVVRGSSTPRAHSSTLDKKTATQDYQDSIKQRHKTAPLAVLY